MAANLVLTADVKVDGSALSGAAQNALRSVRVEMSMWVPNRCSVRFVDPAFELTDANTFAVGKSLTVDMPSAKTGETSPVFAGEITDVSLEPGPSGRHELVVGGLDKSHRLAIATNVKSYTNQAYSAIVQAVAGNSGLTADVSVPGGALPYVLQTTSDYAFLWSIALRTGCEWWVSDGKLHFKKRAATSGPTVSYGEDLLDFRVRYSGATKANKVTVQGWDSGTQAAITSDDSGVLTSTSVPGIGSTATFATGGRSGAAAWGKTIVTGSFAVADAAEAKAVADAVAAQVDAAEVLARGVAEINPLIKVGQIVTVADMGTRVSGAYLVTTVEHIVSAERVETRFTAGNRAPVGLGDLVGGAGTGPAPSRWGSLGLVVGKVTAVKGDPDGEQGRVKVKFPTLSASDESAWARLVSPGGGPGRGLHVTPEVNDEVLVGFEHGDHRFPVILGGLWSKGVAPAVAAAADPVVSRVFRSRLGHQLELSDGDADDKAHIGLTLADGKTKFRLGQDKTDLEVDSGKAFTIKAGSTTIKIDTSGAVTIEGGDVTIKATKDVAISGNNVKINAQMGVTITANTQFKASGTAGATLDAGGAIAEIKGTMVKIN
jgi:phage protein D